MTGSPGPTPAELLDRALTGDRRALGRLLTIIERGGTGADAVTDLTHGLTRGAHVVGVTGAPGSGKSTLVGHLVRAFAESGHRPAVLAVDPSSPLTGGAILGDRIRMDTVVDGRAFIRSMATRGHQGGLALAVPGAVRLYDACGFDPIIVETVGVGQVEVDVAGAADTTVVVVAPGMGDAVQANKAGLLEVADVLVVNKADRPGADDARRDLELMLDLGHVTGHESATGRRTPIVMTTATTGLCVDELATEVGAHLCHLARHDLLEARRAGRLRQEVADRVHEQLNRIVADHLRNGSGRALVAAAADQRLSPSSAAARVLDELLTPSPRRSNRT